MIVGVCSGECLGGLLPDEETCGVDAQPSCLMQLVSNAVDGGVITNDMLNQITGALGGATAMLDLELDK